MTEQSPTTPFFSVVMPLYNKGPHVSRSINSVLTQTFQDFELIIVNDASTDESVEEVRKFNDSRIQLFHRQQPGAGGYAARNLGIGEARGEWVAFLDADDEWYPEHLEKMHELSEKYPDVYFLGCGWEMQNCERTKQAPFYSAYKRNKTMLISLADYFNFCLERKQPVWTSVACIKTSSPEIKNLFPATLNVKRSGDLHAWLKLMCYHKQMAWSNHLGAVYHLDSVNMVTENAPGLELMGQKICHQLSQNLTGNEKQLLKKYLNYEMKKAWIMGVLNETRNLRLWKSLYWRGDFYNALMYSILSSLPESLINILLSLRRKTYSEKSRKLYK